MFSQRWRTNPLSMIKPRSIKRITLRDTQNFVWYRRTRVPSRTDEQHRHNPIADVAGTVRTTDIPCCSIIYQNLVVAGVKRSMFLKPSRANESFVVARNRKINSTRIAYRHLLLIFPTLYHIVIRNCVVNIKYTEPTSFTNIMCSLGYKS